MTLESRATYDLQFFVLPLLVAAFSLCYNDLIRAILGSSNLEDDSWAGVC